MKRQTPVKGRVTAAVLCALALALFAYGPGAHAQTGTSSVRGTVRDQQGSVVSGATVTLTSTERNFSRTQTTSEDGGYLFNTVPPGAYRVVVEAQGFKKVVADVTALVDTPFDLDLHMEPGSITESVTITSAETAPLNTTDATLGNAFESRRIQDLPLNARNVVGLLSLQPGVTRGGDVNGGRRDQANITLDGVDVNEQQRGVDAVTDQAFASVLRVTPDSVQEFRVITTNPNAEQGRSSGAQVSLVTKSGTNEYHGVLYHYHRNTVTSANDFFNNAAGSFGPNDPQVLSGTARVGDPRVPRPQLLRNIFGGAIGGPIKKDKAFFFFTYEGFREATSTSVVRTVPLLQSIGQGVVRYQTANGASDSSCPAGTPAGFRCLTAAQIEAAYLAANGVNPQVSASAFNLLREAARRYPANDTTTGDGINTGGFRFNARTPTELDTYIGRFDMNLTDRQTLFVRGNYQDDLVGQAPNFPDTPAPDTWYHPKGFAVGHSWTASNNFVNRFTYGLTRLSFTQGGDSTDSSLSFRFIFTPFLYQRPLTRITPTHNIVDDVSWIRGNHNFQFGGNLRFIENTRVSFANSFDSLTTNPSGYDLSGAVLTSSSSGADIFPNVAATSVSPLRNALAAVIGRFSQYSANFLYNSDGSILPSGSSSDRTFATEEYEFYFQDSWRMRPNFTLSYGMRWSTSTPVYEVDGFQVVPTVSLGEYFEERVASAERGVPFNSLITLDRGGKFYGKPGFYPQDWNNFAPSIAFAYSPDFGDNFWGRLIGREGKSVIRGGFRLTYDRIGTQLAANFDLSNQLGFASALTLPVNTYNVSTRLAPQFTGTLPDVRTLQGIAGQFSTQLNFPVNAPANQAQRIETSLDSDITTPYNYSINFSYGREVGKGLSFEASYVGRLARNLLAQRDIMHLNNLRDPRSGQTWYEAMNILIDYRQAGVPITSVLALPFFENVLPGLARSVALNGVGTPLTSTQFAYRSIALPRVPVSGSIPCLPAPAAACGQNSTDYTFRQLQWDDQPISIFANTFFHPQYAALNTWSTVGESNYHSAQFTVRQRFRNDLTADFNYTLGHSLDNASGIQSVGNFSSSAFIFNPLDTDLNYGSSDFDVRHIVNANWVWGLPVGRGKAFLHDTNKVTNALLGGWSLTGIFRWNSGFPTGGATRPFGFQRWPTNWNLSSGLVRVAPIESSPSSDVNGTPNIFSDPTAAYLSFRDARPGEAGDRNVFRLPGYFALDAGLYKTFEMPWEGHRVTFRWEVYNVTNTQRFTSPGGFSVSAVDPFLQGRLGLPAITRAPLDFGRFTATQTPLNENKAGRVMQFALRYQF